MEYYNFLKKYSIFTWLQKIALKEQLIGKKPKAKTTAAIKDHALFSDRVVSLEDFKISASSNSEFHLKIKESLLIARDKPESNGSEESLPLFLFD